MSDKNNKCLKLIKDGIKGSGIKNNITRIKDLRGIFANEAERTKLSAQKIVYEVDVYQPVPMGTEGGLFFGITRIYPGQVGAEYFMTRGHFHALSDRAEFYWCIDGVGVLILMDRNRKVWTEKMEPGSLHYISAHVAHRVANTGTNTLSFGACWPADAGHDYKEINKNGFAARLVNINERAVLRYTK